MLGRVGFPGGSAVKNSPANAGDARDTGLLPGWGRSPGGGKGNPLQYSCLENPMDRGTWQAAVHGIAESDTTEQAYTHIDKPNPTKPADKRVEKQGCEKWLLTNGRSI